jgi:hypothetical protein
MAQTTKSTYFQMMEVMEHYDKYYNIKRIDRDYRIICRGVELFIEDEGLYVDRINWFTMYLIADKNLNLCKGSEVSKIHQLRRELSNDIHLFTNDIKQ